MQRFLQPITEHYCDRLGAKRLHGWDFADVTKVVEVGKGCEPRCLYFSFAA